MAFPWQIATSSAAGSLIALAGVFAGAMLTSRTQKRQWSRDKLADACRDVIHESTRNQRALKRFWDDGEVIDWTGWNQALASLWLFGHQDLIDAAARCDETFFRTNRMIQRGEPYTDPLWRQVRDTMEHERLQFINAARTRILRIDAPIHTPLNTRPDLGSPPQEHTPPR
ncbi:hypothetical protein [Amycolatopsis sp. NPDC059021]|uniref:hypothetical protein n=1 Tax=Amycolatopsis sp. NPDC059021 TaxID=3346704 RepID=UPI0036710FFD